VGLDMHSFELSVSLHTRVALVVPGVRMNVCHKFKREHPLPISPLAHGAAV
jgi:hypothetical protein